MNEISTVEPHAMMPAENFVGVSIEENNVVQIKVKVKSYELEKWERFRQLAQSLFNEKATLVPFEYKIEAYKPEGFKFPIGDMQLITMRFYDRKNIFLSKVMQTMIMEIVALTGAKEEELPTVDTRVKSLKINGINV